MMAKDKMADVFTEPRAYTKYCQPGKHETVPEGMIPLEYRWRHVPSGKTGTEVVYVMSRHDLCNLICAWNTAQDTRRIWQYELID